MYMSNSMILEKYRQEMRSGDFDKIHKQYIEESRKLFKKYEVKNKFLAPLIILSIGLAAGEIACIATDNPAGFYALIIPLILSFIAIKINNTVFEKKEMKMWQSGSDYRNAEDRLSDQYYDKYNSVIGYYDQLTAPASCKICADFSTALDEYVCSVTSEPISYGQYCRKCKQQGAFYKCECSKAYYKSLHD